MSFDYPPTRTKPWSNQIDFWKFARNKRAAYAAHEMGAGKTKTAIDFANGINAEKIVVVCPKNVIDGWANQFRIHSHKYFNLYPMTKGTAVTKAKKIEEILQEDKQFNDSNLPIVFILGLQTFWRPPLGKEKDKPITSGTLLRWNWDLFILDEAHRIKAANGRASWGAKRLGMKARRQLYLSGTPMRNSPMDLYAQYRALDPTIFGSSQLAFKANYVLHEIGLGSYKKIVEYKNLDDLKRKFYSIAHHVAIDDVVDLPPIQHIYHYVDLDKDCRRVYDELDQQFIADVEAGIITVKNALVKLLRLAQVTSGIVKLDDGKTTIIDYSKADTICDLINDIDLKEPVIVFCKFHGEMDALQERISKIEGRKVGELSGRCKRPVDFVNSVWTAEVHNVLVVQIQSGGEGVDLTAARYCFYMSKGYSPGEYDQSLKRPHRPGQTRKVIYLHVITKDTVELKIELALKSKAKIIDYIVTGDKVPDISRQIDPKDRARSMIGMAVGDAVDIFSKFEKKPKKPKSRVKQGSIFEDWSN